MRVYWGIGIAGRWSVGLVLLAVGFSQLHAAIQPQLSPMQFREVLEARDAQFDNVELSYVMSGVRKVKDYSYGRSVSSPNARKLPYSPTYEYRFQDALIVRGRDITFLRHQDAASVSEAHPWVSMKWNNFDGVRTEMVRYDKRFSSSPATVEILNNPVAVADGESQHLMAVQFALGLGFGQRIETVTSVEPTDGGHQLKGVLKLWGNDTTKFDLLLDEHFVVRKAVLDANSNGMLTHIEVESSGVRDKGGFYFAEHGHYSLRRDGKLVDGVPRGAQKVPELDFDIDFQDVRFALSDEEYNKLTTIDLPLGTEVVDPHGIGLVNIESVTRTAVIENNERFRSWLVVLVASLAATLLLGLLWLRSRRSHNIG